MTTTSMSQMLFTEFASAPAKRCAFQAPAKVRAWCVEVGVEREHVQESGITMIARKSDRG